MHLRIAIQMDPIELVDINADSTFRIMEEAQLRGHELYYYNPEQLAFEEGEITAHGWPISVDRVKGKHFTKGEFTKVYLKNFDVVWLRQDPPFDMGYITNTHLLEMVHPDTLVVRAVDSYYHGSDIIITCGTTQLL